MKALEKYQKSKGYFKKEDDADKVFVSDETKAEEDAESAQEENDEDAMALRAYKAMKKD